MILRALKSSYSWYLLKTLKKEFNLRNSIGGIVEKPSMNKIFNAGDYIIFRPKLLWEILNF